MRKSIIITGSILLLSILGCGEQESSQSYVEKAKKSISENKLGEGVIELKNAIKLDNKNAEARFTLGKTYLSNGQGLDAAKEFERALQFNFDKNSVIPMLARAYLISRQEDDVLDLEKELKNLNVKAQEQYLFFNVIANLTKNELANAKLSYDKISELSNDSFSHFAALAYITFAEQQYDTSKDALNQALTLEPKNPEALLLQAKLGTVTKEYAAASKAYSEYLEVQPASMETELMLASSLMSEQKLEEAVKYADKILAVLPNQPFANFVKAMSAINVKNYTDASKYSELAIQHDMNQPNVRLIAGVSAFYLKNFEQAHYHLGTLAKYLPPEHFARRMLAVSQVELGVITDVTDTLSGFEANTEEDAEFISALGFKLLQAGATNEAKQLMGKSANVSSQDANQLLREGVLKLMLNDPTAVEHLSEAINQDPELVKAELAMAYLAVKNKEFDKAVGIAQKWQEKYPNKVDGFNLMSAIKFEQQDVEGAKEELDRSLAIDENNVFALLQRVKIAIIENDELAAKKYASEALSSHPDNVKVLRQYFMLNPNQKALELIKAKFEGKNDQVIFRLLYAEALIKLSEFGKAIKLLNEHKPTNQTPKYYWNLKLVSYKALKDADNIKSMMEEWVKVNPFHIEPVIFLVDIHSANRNFDRAIRVLNNAREYHADNATLDLVKTLVYIEAQRVDEAKSLYSRLDRSQNLPVLDYGIPGRIALLEKEYDVAADKLRSFYEQKPNTRNLMYLVAAYSGQKRLDRAIGLVESHIADSSSSAYLNTTLANLNIQNNDQVAALAIYNKMLENGSDNVIVLNNAAWLSMDNGEIDKAMSFAKRAFELAPKVPNVIDTYSQTLFKAGQNREALSQAKVAYELSNMKSPEIALNYVEILVAVGRKNEAKAVIESIKTANSDQANRKQKISAQL